MIVFKYIDSGVRKFQFSVACKVNLPQSLSLMLKTIKAFRKISAVNYEFAVWWSATILVWTYATCTLAILQCTLRFCCFCTALVFFAHSYLWIVNAWGQLHGRSRLEFGTERRQSILIYCYMFQNIVKFIVSRSKLTIILNSRGTGKLETIKNIL